MAPFSVVAKLFSNSLLASLNERQTSRRDVAQLSSKNRFVRSAESGARVTFERVRIVRSPRLTIEETPQNVHVHADTVDLSSGVNESHFLVRAVTSTAYPEPQP